MMSLKEKYSEEVIPALQRQFSYVNKMMVPKITKVVLNIGAGKALQDAKYLEVMENTLVRITGQRPVKTKAKKSIASFKIRAGMVVGFKVTLRQSKMWDFLSKLVNVTLPRVRDFRGLDRSGFDHQGNYSLGLRESLAFPEISSDEMEKAHGLEITIATNATNDQQALALLTALGFPFKKPETAGK